jgi:putative DNA primase/helicase
MPSVFEDIAQKFNVKVRKDKKGPYIKIAGPGHSSADDSLMVRPHGDDDFTVHSFAGDDWEGAKDWIREQTDQPAFLKKGKKNGNGKNGKDGGTKTLVAEYIYATAQGKPYLKVKKFVDERGKKHFYQEHWDSKDWVKGKPAGPKIPYRLPELIASPVSIPVYLAEGEKDALALAEIGLIATTISEGANAPWDDALTEHFAGRTIVILPDADVPGRAHAQKVAKALFGTADEIRILELWPDRDDGFDVSEYLKGDPTGAQLILSKIRKAVPEWTLADVKTEEDIVADELDGLDGIEKARRKKELAKELGITAKELDKALADKSAMEQPAHWACEPWAEPVLTGPLLDMLSAHFTAHIILPPHGADTMALWTLHAWALDAAYASPFLLFTAPIWGCGKTRAMESLLFVVPRGIMSSNITPSAIFRYIDLHHPSLLFDEAETHLKREDTRGILDSGHTRLASFVIRNTGDAHEPKLFSTWGPKVIGGLKQMEPTIRDRSIIIPMKRKKKIETVVRTRNDTDAFKAIRRQALRWANDNTAALKDAKTAMPGGLSDRAEDNWELLLSIADLAGPEWATKARAAALALSGGRDADDDSLGIQLLVAIKGLIDGMATTSSERRVSSQVIMDHLHKIEDGPWLAYGRMEKPISKKQIANLLRDFHIAPGSKRIGGNPNNRGYEFAAFKDVFDAYLDHPPSRSATPPQPNENKGLAQIRSATPDQTGSECGGSECR